MRENRFFILGTDLTGRTPVVAAGKPAILHYADLVARVEAISGRDAAALFAEPVLPRGAQGQVEEAQVETISWYGSREGQPTELELIDEVARRPILERLSERLNALAPALEDPRVGPTLAAWLAIPSTKDIKVIDGEPLLVNWGYLPAEVAADPARWREHFVGTLGRFAPGLTRLVVPEPEGSRSFASAASAVPPPIPPPSVAVPSVAGAAAPPWRAPAIAASIAGLILLLLLLPGVLVYPERSRRAAYDDFEAERSRLSNESLEAQLEALQKAQREKACRADGPSSIVVPGLPPTVPGTEEPAPHMELLPRAPDQVPLPPRAGGEAAQAANVAELLEKSTVLVLLKTKAAGNAAAGSSQGSGFFISDQHIVTNKHVVENADPDLVFVASKAFNGARRARIVGVTEAALNPNELSPDIAVLEIDPPAGVKPLGLGTTPAKLSTAYVAGFPGFLVRHDTAFDRFLQQLTETVATDGGDQALAAKLIETPGADLRYGRINNVMRVGGGEMPVVIHDMQLAPGNSGGPLVDACGRLGGINTAFFSSGFDPQHPGPMQQGNVAQDVSVLRKFLAEKAIAFTADDAACAPPGAGAAPPPPAGDAPPPSPSPPPADPAGPR